MGDEVVEKNNDKTLNLKNTVAWLRVISRKSIYFDER